MARKLFTVSNYIIISISYHRFIKEADKMLILVKFLCVYVAVLSNTYILFLFHHKSCWHLSPAALCLVLGSTAFIKSRSCHQMKGDIGEINYNDGQGFWSDLCTLLICGGFEWGHGNWYTIFYVMRDTAIIIVKTLGATIQKLVSWVTSHMRFSDISSHHIPIHKYWNIRIKKKNHLIFKISKETKSCACMSKL